MQADIGSATARRWVLRVLQALGVAWALPYTALGLVAGDVERSVGSLGHIFVVVLLTMAGGLLLIAGVDVPIAADESIRRSGDPERVVALGAAVPLMS